MSLRVNSQFPPPTPNWASWELVFLEVGSLRGARRVPVHRRAGSGHARSVVDPRPGDSGAGTCERDGHGARRSRGDRQQRSRATGQRDRRRHDAYRPTTDAQGRAEFTDLPTGGTNAIAEVTVDGEKLVSQPFAVPASGGLRVILVAGIAKAAERKKQEEAAAAAEPPTKGIVDLRR